MERIYSKDTRIPLNTISRKEIINGFFTGTTINLYGDKNHWVIFQDQYTPKCLGSKIFYKKVASTSLTYKNKKFFGDMSLMYIVFSVFKIDWMKSTPYIGRFLINKTFCKMILQGKITNPEDLIKKYSSLYFNKAYSYKNLKIYFQSECPLSLHDIFYYTTNPDLFLEKYFKVNWDFRNLMMDTLKYCSYENSRLNPNWSKRRFEEEHQKQIQRSKAEEISKLFDEDITLPFKMGPLELITNEKECYLESNEQNNCLFNCYWPKIKQGNYLAFKGIVNGERVTLGLSCDSENIRFDQVRLNHNQSPKTSLEYFTDLINGHISTLNKIVTDIKLSVAT